MKSNCKCDDLIHSIALEEASLAHILNAEGEKMQKFIELASTTDELLILNDKVLAIVNGVKELEIVLLQKMIKCQEGGGEKPTPCPIESSGVSRTQTCFELPTNTKRIDC